MAGAVLKVSESKFGKVRDIFLVSIVIVSDSVIEKVCIVSSDTISNVVDLVNIKFKEIIKEYATIAYITEEDIEIALDEGYISLPDNKYEIYLVWPEIDNDIIFNN